MDVLRHVVPEEESQLIESLEVARRAKIILETSLAEDDGPARCASTIYFEVPDIYQAYETLMERGAEFDDLPHLIVDMGDYEIWMAFFHDSEQNTLAISTEIPRQGN